MLLEYMVLRDVGGRPTGLGIQGLCSNPHFWKVPDGLRWYVPLHGWYIHLGCHPTQRLSLTNVLVRDYLLNLCTFLDLHDIAIDCALEDGTVHKAKLRLLFVHSQELKFCFVPLHQARPFIPFRSSGLDLLSYPPISLTMISLCCCRVRSSHLRPDALVPLGAFARSGH